MIRTSPTNYRTHTAVVKMKYQGGSYEKYQLGKNLSSNQSFFDFFSPKTVPNNLDQNMIFKRILKENLRVSWTIG